MSAELVKQVLRNNSVDGTQRLVLLILAWRADPEGQCWPTVEHLADDAALSPRQVKRVLKELEAAGQVEIPRGARSKERPFTITPGDTGVNGGVIEGKGEGTPSRGREEKNGLKEEVERSEKKVWDYYLAKIPSRRVFGDKQRRQIAAALKVRTIDEIKLAIDGLAASPHHNGINDRNTKYLELHYAIVPRGVESIEERIDKAASWGKANVNGAVMEEYKRNRLVEAIQLTQRFDHRPQQNRADDARAELEAAGYTVTLLDRAPWVTVTL